MERRAFLGAVTGGLLAAPLGQLAAKVYRMGIMENIPVSDAEWARLWGAFIQEVRSPANRMFM